MYCRHAEEAWSFWKAGKYGDVSLTNAILEYAKTQVNDCIPEVVKAMRVCIMSTNCIPPSPVTSPSTPIILSGMNALRLPTVFENLGHSNVILAAGDCALGQAAGPKQNATACRHGGGSLELLEGR